MWLEWWGAFLRLFEREERERLFTSNWARRGRRLHGLRMAKRLEKEEEVYVIRYEKGIAYVKRWEDWPLAAQGTSEQETEGVIDSFQLRTTFQLTCPGGGPGDV